MLSLYIYDDVGVKGWGICRFIRPMAVTGELSVLDVMHSRVCLFQFKQ
jgi:hypothetical protein